MDEMRDGESYTEYIKRFKNEGYSDKELQEKATAAWYARREAIRQRRHARQEGQEVD